MKKLTLMAVSAFALVAAGAHAKNFDGMYAGVRANHNWDEIDFQEQLSPNSETVTVKPKGFSGDVTFGHMNNIGNNFVAGVEIFVGSSNYKDNKNDVLPSPVDSSVSIQKGYTVGIDAIGGYQFMPELLGYGRLGIKSTETKYKFFAKDDTDTFRMTAKNMVPAISVGFGAMYAVMDNINLDFGYTYSQDLHDEEFQLGAVTTSKVKKGTQHSVHAGVSYVF